MADFVLGRLKFKWRGDWAVSTAYLIDEGKHHQRG